MHLTRRQRLTETFADRKIEGFIITALPNVRYLSGFTGSNAVLLLTRGNSVLFTDPRYTVQAGEECDCTVRTVRGSLAASVAAAISRMRLRRVGFEKQRISWASYSALESKLRRVELVPVDGAVETSRMIKSPEEIAIIRKSVDVNSRALERSLRQFKSGMREMDLAAELDYQMRRLGASNPAFDTIVAAGDRTALPHAQPSAVSIDRDQLLLVDMGATVDGYASDMTRVFFTGTPKPGARKMYRAVLEAQEAAIAAVRPGVTAASIDRAARTVLKKRGMERAFVHSTGHGLGLEIHEAPRLGKTDRTKLQPGMTITIEPGVYYQGMGGIRIEDTVLVTEKGCEVLTPTTKEFLSI